MSPRVNWSEAEVRATVEDYFWMLERELRGETYSKTIQRHALIAKLQSRPPGAVERKHQNISGVLLELGFPFVRGYKPLLNYQGLLRDVVLERLAQARSLIEAADQLSQGVPAQSRALADPVAAPELVVREKPRISFESGFRSGRTDYVARDQRNRELGLRGEEIVIGWERQSLVASGRSDLASRVRWTSQDDGDGAGYDIESYYPDGAVRLIEVKTTNHHDRFPFLVTRNEVEVSERRAAEYHLVRVFDFSRDPRHFILPGSIRDHFELEPTGYRASFLKDR